MSRKILLALLLHSILFSVYEGLLYFQGNASSDHVRTLWQIIFLLFIIMWVDSDSRVNRKSERCFDYAFLVYIFSPIYVPYYCYRTRGFLLGTIILLSLLLLYSLSYFVQWGIYYFS